ncbi:15077_t:CDS:2 [Entrophospora sp. SA101]|nr:15077_t:CDS:2 [Entrophospora sp. SA101]
MIDSPDLCICIIRNLIWINLGIAVKYKDNPPSGWKFKYYIPTILLPGENPNNIKEIKCHSNIIIGYRFNINKERNNDEKGKQVFKNNSTNDYTNNPQDIELLYINMSRDALLSRHRYLWTLCRTCKLWNEIIPLVISGCAFKRFNYFKDLEFELLVGVLLKDLIISKIWNSRIDFGTYDKKKYFKTTLIKFSRISVKYKDNPPSGWKFKYYIPTILLPGENPNNIKEIKCHSNIIIGYRFNINKERNNDEKGKQVFKNNSTNDYTNNPQDIELLYINMSRDALLRYMDNMDNLNYLISATGIN